MITDFNTFRSGAIRYWERRRAFYNLALLPPSLLAYLVGAALVSGGDAAHLNFVFVLFLFTVSAIGANICYTFAYAAEFLWGNDDPSSPWLRTGRTNCFIIGTLFSMVLAAIGGRNIAFLEFDRKVRQLQFNLSIHRTPPALHSPSETAPEEVLRSRPADSLHETLTRSGRCRFGAPREWNCDD